MPAPAGARRTQAERTEVTRSALVEATIRAIRDDGYRATTTRRIAEYAGVSLGAVAHHYPARADLIAAALDAVAKRLIDSIAAESRNLAGPPPDRAGQLLDILWTNFTGESFLVWLRVWLAAADDPELRDAVLNVDQRMSAELARILPDLRPADMARPTWMRRVNVALDAIRGLSLLVHYQPRRDTTAPNHWQTTRSELIALLSR